MQSYKQNLILSLEAELQEPLKIEKIDVENSCKKLKKKKAEDYEGWKNEMILYGGKEMISRTRKG